MMEAACLSETLAAVYHAALCSVLKGSCLQHQFLPCKISDFSCCVVGAFALLGCYCSVGW